MECRLETRTKNLSFDSNPYFVQQTSSWTKDIFPERMKQRYWKVRLITIFVFWNMYFIFRPRHWTFISCQGDIWRIMIDKIFSYFSPNLKGLPNKIYFKMGALEDLNKEKFDIFCFGLFFLKFNVCNMKLI